MEQGTSNEPGERGAPPEASLAPIGLPDRALGWGLAVAVAILYLIIGTFRLDRPGLYYDEMLFVNAAIGADSTTFIFLRIGRLPVLLMPYLGALKAWLYTPLFAAFGVSPAVVRLPVLLLGLGSVGVTYLLCREALSRRASLAVAALTALDPSLLFHTRLDWGPTAIMVFLKSLLCLFVLRFVNHGRRRDAVAALVAGALGTFDKLTFLAVCGAALGTVALLAPRRLRELGTRPAWIALGGVVSGGVAFLLVALRDPRLGAAVIVPDYAGHARLLGEQVIATLEGVGVYAFLFGTIPVAGHRHLLAWGAAGGLAVLAALFRRPGSTQSRFAIFFALFGVILFGELCLVRRAVGPHHAVMLSPTWILCLGALIDRPLNALGAARQGFRGLVSLSCALVALVVVATSSVQVAAAYWARWGGPFPPNWDPGSATLATYARAHPEWVYASTDWGTHTVVQGLTGGRVRCLDLWPLLRRGGPSDLESFQDRLFAAPALAVLHASGAETFPETRRRFAALAASEGWTLDLVAAFPTSEGNPFLELYRVGRPEPVRLARNLERMAAIRGAALPFP
jgi:hypothetical protein